MQFKGTWSATTTYGTDDVVFFNGSSYVSLIKNNIGNQPNLVPADWAVLAAQGPTGPTGPTGPQGPAGPSNVFSTSGTQLHLPAGSYRVSGLVNLHLPQQANGTGYFTEVSGNIAPSVGGSFATFSETVAVGANGTPTDVNLSMQGVITLANADVLTLSISLNPNPAGFSFNSLEFEAIQVGSITQQ